MLAATGGQRTLLKIEISEGQDSYLCGHLAVQVQFNVNILSRALAIDSNLLLLDVNLQSSGVNLRDIEGEEQFVPSLCPGDRSGALAKKGPMWLAIRINLGKFPVQFAIEPGIRRGRDSDHRTSPQGFRRSIEA